MRPPIRPIAARKSQYGVDPSLVGKRVLRFREIEEYIKRYGLDAHYKGKAIGVAPVDQGIAIETEIGTLYGIKKIYDADWIVHAHHSDVREVHFHRQVDKAVKPFGMSYARIETRSTYHQNLGLRAANFVARAIFESLPLSERSSPSPASSR